MTATVSPAYLMHVESGSMVAAELWDAITEQQLRDWEGEWVPELFKGMQRLTRSGVERKHFPQSRHWDWRMKTVALQPLLAYPGFSVVCAGVTQGMMIVENTQHRCQLPEQAGKNLIYVEYVENAPWNRADLSFGKPTYRGVGSLLIRAAIELSKEEGFKGRLGLHSLPQSNDWYANVCGMTDLGMDPKKENLRYFEMSATQADAFIAKGY